MRLHDRFRPSLVCAVAAALLAAPAAAQNTVGEISGYVTDASGAVLPGASVTVTFPELALQRTVATNADGFYVLANLPYGKAELRAELSGFQKATRSNIDVELLARLRIDLTLAVGGVSETVEVTAQQPVISTRADVAHLISGEQTREIPIDGRSYMQLVSLIPGVARNDSSYEFGTSLRADGQQINGLRKNLSGLTLDGAENLDAGSNATQVNNVSIDAIEEFKVLSSQYSAEYGKAGGAQINVVTKRGKRDFAGGLYYFFRDDSLDAKNFLTGTKDALEFKNFGWNFSGPVSFAGWNPDRSKLFFFAGQEYKRLDNQVGLTRIATVPSLLERRGDFSQSPRQPRDPLTGQPFPGGLIPAERLSRNGVNLVSRFPAPDAGARNQATLKPTQNRDITETILRFDVKTGSASNLSIRLIRDTVEQLEPYGSFGGTSTFAQVPTSHDRGSDSLVLNYNHTLGPRTVNEISLSAVKNNQDLIQTGDVFGRAGLQIPEVFPSNRGGRAPNVRTLTGYTLGTGLLGNDYPTHIIGNYYTLKDNLTLLRGSHTWKFGVYVGHFRKAEEIRTPDAGAFTFSDNRAGGSGIALADALLGLYETYTEADAAPLGNLRYDQIEVYAQDHWQVRANFTLDYGVRYQWMPPVYERNDRIATFDPARYNAADAPQIAANGTLIPGTGLRENGLVVAGIAKAGVNGIPRGLYQTDWNNVAPRVGFTWDPWKTGRTAIRGGFGIYFDRPVFNSTRDQASSPPFVRTLQLSNGSLDTPGGGAASTAPQGGFDALATDFPMPTVYSYSIGVQRRLPWSLVADVNYVGNQARHLLRVRELNFVEPAAATGVAPTPVNANRPYTGYSRIFVNETSGRSEYNSLQVALNRRGDTPLNFGIAYTLGRALGDSDSEDSSSSGSLAQDPRNLAAEYGNQDFDRRHVLVANYIWKLPAFKGTRRLQEAVLGGWQLSGITRFQSGRRYSVSAGTNTAIFGDQVTIRANLVPGQDPNAAPEGGRTPQRFFNTAAFARPAANRLGDSPRNVLEGPSLFTTDLSVFKNFRLGKRAKLQLRGEGFNVFNKRNYRSIETNITNARFGQVTAYEAQRIFQLGVKLNF
jgi:hypothetical protein